MTRSPLSTARRLPILTEVNRGYWTSGADGRLRMRRCQQCRTWNHPPTLMCPACRSRELEWSVLSGRSELYSYTINQRAWAPSVPVPYVIALVELDEQPGLRLTTNIRNADPDDLHIGMRLRVAFEDHGEIFVPVFEPDPGPRSARGV